MTNKEWIAYVGPFSFPWGQPGSRRVCGIARSLSGAGYDVVIGCGGQVGASSANLNEGEQEGSITYVGLGETPPAGFSLKKLFQIFVFWGRKTVTWLDSQPLKPKYVFVYGGSAQYMFWLLPWCRRNQIPLIADVVEWYDPRQLKGGFFGPFHVSAKIALHYLYPKCDGIIAISTYLTDYFRQFRCPVITIPPTLDVINNPLCFNATFANKAKLTLIYSGSPGRKDLLDNIIRGVAQADPTGKQVQLLVMGPSLEQVQQLLNMPELPASVVVLGNVLQQEVFKIIQQADFSVLLREPLRFAHAGFPTKFVESMANGIPVIANITSDLDMYLHEGIEGLICRDHSASAFAEAIQRALLFSPEKLQKMRLAARTQAESSFDFRQYISTMSDFLSNIT